MDYDEIIREVRSQREAYAERFDFDIEALYRDAKERERTSGRKLVTLEPRRVESAAPGELEKAQNSIR